MDWASVVLLAGVLVFLALALVGKYDRWRQDDWVTLPRDEVIDALRGQVSSLQIKRNRLGEKCAEMAAARGRMKGQVADDQRYIDALEKYVPPKTIAEIREQMKDARASRRGMPSAQPENSGGAVSREGET